MLRVGDGRWRGFISTGRRNQKSAAEDWRMMKMLVMMLRAAVRGVQGEAAMLKGIRMIKMMMAMMRRRRMKLGPLQHLDNWPRRS